MARWPTSPAPQLGLDASAASVPYIAGWAADDADAIECDVALIDELAQWFHNQLAADMDAASDPVEAELPPLDA